MNYFELHLGDYEAATAHLSMLEDAVYCRMLRVYYRTERPLPAEVRQICRLVRAVSEPEREAVQQVLSDFFVLADDGWHQDRCDEEIERYASKEPERALRKANEDNRLRKHRDERAALFKVITEAGEHAPWNIPIKDLRAMSERIGVPATASATPATQPETATATVPATPATATQTPAPTSQTPLPSKKHCVSAARLDRDWALPDEWGNWALTKYPHWKRETVQLIAEAFRDHWCAKSGKDATKLDWEGTWRNWCRSGITQRDFPPPRMFGNSAPTRGEQRMIAAVPHALLSPHLRAQMPLPATEVINAEETAPARRLG